MSGECALCLNVSLCDSALLPRDFRWYYGMLRSHATELGSVDFSHFTDYIIIIVI